MLDLDAHEIDLALRALQTLPDSDLVAHKLAPLTGKLFGAPGYLETRGRPRRPADLSRHTLLLRRPSARKRALLTMTAGAKVEKISVAPRLTSMDFAVVRAAALAGLGIAELPTVTTADDAARGTLVPVLPGYVLFEASLSLMTRKTAVLPRRTRALRDFLLARFAAR